MPWFWSIRWRHILDKVQFVVLVYGPLYQYSGSGFCSVDSLEYSIDGWIWTWWILLLLHVGRTPALLLAIGIICGLRFEIWRGCSYAMRYAVFIRWTFLPPLRHFLSFFFLSKCEARGGWQDVNTEDVCILPWWEECRVEWQEKLRLIAVVEDFHVKTR